MIDRIIVYSIRHCWSMVAGGLLLAAAGLYALQATPVDAIPDLSEAQVIVYVEWAGHGPEEVQDAITFPVSNQFHGLDGVRTVRGSSDSDFSWIHVIFDDSASVTDARQRVVDQLTRVNAILPPGAVAKLAPDAPATGQLFWYTVEGAGQDLAELRSIQDRLIRDRLVEIPGVAEVASVGGFHREYQVTLSSTEIAALGLNVSDVVRQLKAFAPDNLRSQTWNQAEIRLPGGGSIPLSRIADVHLGPAARTGMVEKDGNEVVGGVILMKHGADPLRVIQRVRDSLDDLRPRLPAGVRIMTAYDRTPLIRGVTTTVTTALLEAMLIAGLCVVLVTRHLRASLVVLLTLPLAVLSAFAALFLLRRLGWLDIQINMMSLAGITISIGVLVDSSIVMAENVMHRLHDRWGEQTIHGDVSETVIAACNSVGRPIFFSVMIMLLSFLPVFALGGMEGKMFRPLAISKSLALAAAALLAITLVPALCVLLIRGRMIAERRNWLVRSLVDVYQPLLRFSLHRPLPLLFVLAATLLAGTAPLGSRPTYLAAVAIAIGGVWMAAKSGWSRVTGTMAIVVIALLLESRMSRLDKEFLTPLDEGTAMDMPITIPGIPASQAIDDLKARNMVLCRYPEVEMVMGKVGRADTPTDPAPLDMIETMIGFRPRAYWPRRRWTESGAHRELDWIWEYLTAGGYCVPPQEATERHAFLGDVVPMVLEPFHTVLREYAYQRNQECLREAAHACIHRLANDIHRSSQVALAAAARVPPELVTNFAMDSSGDLVPELVREILDRSSATDVSGAIPHDAVARRFAAPAVARWRRMVAAERRDIWQRHVRQLNGELLQRSAPTFAFLSLRHLLSASVVHDPVLRGEVERLRAYQQVRVRGSQRTHHGTIEPARPDVDPTPRFDAIAAEVSRSLASRLVLRACSRSEIAGFGGEMDSSVTLPGWTNVWTMPIQNRVDMLATGVNTTVGIRVLGPQLPAVVDASERIAAVVRQVPGAAGVVADPVRTRTELTVRWNHPRAAALGVDPDDVQATIAAATTGIVVVESNGVSQQPAVRVRLDASSRRDTESLRKLPVLARTATNEAIVELGQMADVARREVPTSLKSENGRSRNYVRLNVHGRDSAEFIREAQHAVAQRVSLPPGVTVEWTGEFEHRLRARQRLRVLVPAVLVVIFAVLWLTYHDLADAVLMLLAVPGALAGGVLMQWILNYKLTVTVAMGYIACLGMATSTGIIMLVYLREAVDRAGGLAGLSLEELRTAVMHGAVHRLRPKLLTEATTILGLAPMLWATGVGAEVIRPMSAPVLGGILVADEVIDLLLPVLFFWVRRRRWERARRLATPTTRDPLPKSRS